ncbi:hypothetical protein FQN49_001190 [Arthroderma sp. PD_2]|nr:hypothetical protein FQN49_001190 [Arthroderma sp. PD_2]
MPRSFARLSSPPSTIDIKQTPKPDFHDTSAMSQGYNQLPLNSVLSALGTLIGYIGTEVASDTFFHRVLWPQRAYNNLRLQNAWKLALFSPMGGPLHKAALQTMDKFFENGLFQGAYLGRMLGTAFLIDGGATYQRYEGHGSEAPSKQGQTRNGIWIRALSQMPAVAETQSATSRLEDGKHQGTVRQKVTVSHLVLSSGQAGGKASGDIQACPLVEGDIGAVAWGPVAGILVSEATAIFVAIAVTIVWRSGFMVLWLMPLLLKILSALSTVHREGLKPPAQPLPQSEASRNDENLEKPDEQSDGHKSKLFLIRTVQGFQLIEGPDHVVTPFFRHYGHPQRCRWREVVQIAVIAGFGLIFPVGLVCSSLWMPLGLQALWTAHALYVTIALYISRYACGGTWATTEERIAGVFSASEKKGEACRMRFQDGGALVVVAELVRTTHDTYLEAESHAQKLIRG